MLILTSTEIGLVVPANWRSAIRYDSFKFSLVIRSVSPLSRWLPRRATIMYTHWTKYRILTCMCPLQSAELLKKQMAPRRARAAGGTGMSSGSEGSVMPSQWTIKTKNKICTCLRRWGFIMCPPPRPVTPFLRSWVRTYLYGTTQMEAVYSSTRSSLLHDYRTAPYLLLCTG
jgi:hypothetical protein